MKEILVEVGRSGGAWFDGCYISSGELVETVKELYLERGFEFKIVPACGKVAEATIQKVCRLLRE